MLFGVPMGGTQWGLGVPHAVWGADGGHPVGLEGSLTLFGVLMEGTW